MTRPLRRALPLAMSALLAACAGMPPQAPPAPPAATPSLSAQLPELPSPPATVSMPAPAPTTNVWDRLRSSFAMPDCNADPSVLRWAQRYTRNPQHFEKTLRLALPRLDYVQQVAAQYHVPGEFVLLPWVESHYRSVPTRKRQPAGIWQIMPTTVRALNLRADRHYDGRLDIRAATHAVMQLLAQYHDRFNDWRVADYAYNTGEFRLRRLVRDHGSPPDEPVIPNLPVSTVTREHLVKLLAMACVVREPEHFHVRLPVLPETERLTDAPLAHSMSFAQAADLAGIPVAALRQLNPAFRGDTINAAYTSTLVLPAGHAKRFRNAEPASIAATSGSATRRHADSQSTRIRHKIHVVSPGESLWQIARDNATSVTRLKQLNDLQGPAIQSGEVLQLDDVD